MTPRLLLCGLLLCGAGCMRHYAAPEPGSGEQSGPQDLAAYEQDLARAEAQLDQLLGDRPAQYASAPEGATPSAGAPAAAPPPAPAPQSAPAEVDSEPAADAAVRREAKRGPTARAERKTIAESADDDEVRASSPCAGACRAVASMRRSADAICRLSGADHERCRNAEQRVSEAARRLERAGCSCR